MIVDLERNDLSRVCEPGSVRWPELMVERELAGVVHLVSTVEGTLRDGRRARRAARGDVPRRLGHRRAEDRRGRPHRGARARRPRRRDGRARTRLANGDLELALTIRTFAVAEDTIHLWVGGGIVWDSEPEAEIEESLVKARRCSRRSRAAAAAARDGRSRSRSRDEASSIRTSRAPRGRRSGAPWPGRVRDVARVRGRPFRLTAHLVRLGSCGARRRLPPVDAAGFAALAEQALAEAATPDSVLRLVVDTRPSSRARRSRSHWSLRSRHSSRSSGSVASGWSRSWGSARTSRGSSPA